MGDSYLVGAVVSVCVVCDRLTPLPVRASGSTCAPGSLPDVRRPLARIALTPSPAASQQLPNDDQYKVSRSREAMAQPVQAAEQSNQCCDQQDRLFRIVQRHCGND